MGNIVFEYRQIEQKIGDLKEIAIIIKEMNKNPLSKDGIYYKIDDKEYKIMLTYCKPVKEKNDN